MKRIALIFLISIVYFLISGPVLDMYSKLYFKISNENDEIVFFVIGGSNAYGDPYDQRPSFINIVSDNLNGKILNKKIKIVSFAEPAKTLGENLLDFWIFTLLTPPKTAMVFIYAGINECFINDSKYQPSFWYSYINFYIVSYFIQGYHSISSTFSLENSPGHFVLLLSKFINISSKYNYPIFLSSIAGNFHNFDPPVDLDELSESILLKANLKELFKHLKDVNSVQLKRYIYFRIAKIYQNNKDMLNAKKYFKSAYDFNCSVRPEVVKNQIIKNMSLKPGVHYINFLEDLQRLTNSEYIGDNYYQDAHHLTLEGYNNLAQLFVDKLNKNYNLNIQKRIPYEKIFIKYDIADRLGHINFTRSIWYTYFTLRTKYHNLRSTKALSYIDRARKNNYSHKNSMLLIESINSLFLGKCKEFFDSLSLINITGFKKENFFHGFPDVYKNNFTKAIDMNCPEYKNKKEKVLELVIEV